ncbi:hypothetical protein F2P47_09995 [Parvibaculum sedimenti]|uniref:Uncharacterized protein n=1 Tax=Parvibaculum sedimenti TaxID=2608632 RepID=A0A6N6VHM5_9HYPH|nr:hypothetical protein [Parvibaculum sedimenti]KAB7739837.1 hypothetical protein F2P47_09995 [Parvibaculum sedimenti]
MNKRTIWISYDLGVRGDYESLYAWLDSHDAKECGDSVAVLAYEYQGSLVKMLKEELGRTITTDKRTRLYVIYREPSTKKMKGNFIFGGRRTPPWTGYSSRDSETVDDEI